MTYGQLVTRVRSLAGLDVTDQQAKDELNDRYADLVVRSRWRMMPVTVAQTVAGQGNYDLPGAVTDLDMLRVGSVLYERIGQRQMWELDSAATRLGRKQGYGGAFAPDWKADGTAQVELRPAPATSGQVIEALVAQSPTPMVGDTDVPIVPEDFHAAIADGTVGKLLALVDERHDQAVYWEQRFEQAVERLRRRQNSRVGSGPVQIQLSGVHF